MKTIKQILNAKSAIYRNVTPMVFCRNYCRQQQQRPAETTTTNNIIKSPIPDVPIPDMNLAEFLFRNIDRWIDRTAVICADTGRSYTYGQTQQMSERFAHALHALFGLRKGDIVAILLPNIPEVMIAFLGTLRSGIVYTTINPIYTADEIAHQMKDCSAKAIITLTQSYNIVEQAIKKLKTNEHIPVITIKHQRSDVTPSGAIDFKELCEYSGSSRPFERPCAEDLACLPYSSGTSGLPKGVQMLHRNIVADLVQIQHDWIKATCETTKSHQDVVPVMTPLYHAYGMIPVAFNIFSEGGKCVLQPKYTPDLFLNMLENYPGHILYLVPTIVLMLTNNQRAMKKHLKNIRHILCAAAPLSELDVQRFQQKFGDYYNVKQFYGLTETGPVSHGHILDREVVPGSVGWNLSFTECRVVSVDDERQALGPLESGHLLMRGANVMPRYHKNAEATKQALDEEGWFRTGDIAMYDHEGRFYITDRIKELIKVKGYQVAPAELEALIRDHPAVDDAAVTGVAHPQHGEVPKAFVVPRQGVHVKPEHIQDYVKEKAAKYKHLHGGVVFIDSVPKNPSGKILRRVLKNM